MDREKVSEIVLIVLGCIAALMVVATLFIVTKHETDLQTTCEELRAKKGNEYIPLPKRCEKGE